MIDAKAAAHLSEQNLKYRVGSLESGIRHIANKGECVAYFDLERWESWMTEYLERLGYEVVTVGRMYDGEYAVEVTW